jgi:hypothetical protein
MGHAKGAEPPHDSEGPDSNWRRAGSPGPAGGAPRPAASASRPSTCRRCSGIDGSLATGDTVILTQAALPPC